MDKNTILNNTFFRLNPEFRLHIRPDGGNIYPLPKTGDPTLSSKTFDLNLTATKIIEQCGGASTFESIISILSRDDQFDHDVESFISDISDCLLDACDKGFVEAITAPCQGAISVTGNYDFHTPRHLTVELTDHCNLICKHCYRNSSPTKDQQLSGDELISILKQFADMGLITIELTGGEATVHPDFIDILKYCCSIFQKTALLTNGFDIRDEVFKIMHEHRDRVTAQIDLDGSNAESHDWLRGVEGSYENTIKAIRSFVSNKIPLRVSMNVHPDNITEIDDVVAKAQDLGATWFAFTIVLPLGRGRSIQAFSTDQLQFLKQKTDEFRRDYPGFFFHLDDSQVESFNNPDKNCGAGWSSLTLGPTGHLRPCPMFDEPYLSLGDLTKEPLTSILESHSEHFRFLTNIKTPSIEECGDCKHAALCHGCIARPVSINRGNFEDCKWGRKSNLEQIF